ncbi:kinesin-1-like [Dorcoceras hygrometricum]|uniref:Kinesin-1-like n=1 Tax=Dorcoceras hygrometricum TaxID=472368 RepID=A0A2Z7AS09_9LAMI|nr:kinesin-1-like [Dorcoceras hygrometricum]
MYKLYELEVQELYNEHLANFKLDVPSVNHDYLCLQFLNKELKGIATLHRTQRAMAGLPIFDEEVSFLESASTQPQLLALEFSDLADQEQAAAQTRSHQIYRLENENTAMITLEHQAQENEPPVQTEEHQAIGDEHQAHDEQGSEQQNTENTLEKGFTFETNSSDHLGPFPTNLQLVAPTPTDPSTLQFMDTTDQTLTILSTCVSSLDLTWARIHDDTNLMRLLGNRGGSGSRLPARQRKNKNWPGNDQYNSYFNHAMTIHRVFLGVTFLATRAWLRPVSRGNRHFTVGGGRLRQSGPRPEARLLRQPALEGLTRSAWTDSPRQVGWNKFRRERRIGYPRMSASGESSTTMHRLLHASGSHPIPPPDDPKTNQYNQDLGLIHSTNGNHLESPNEGSSIDHQWHHTALLREKLKNAVDGLDIKIDVLERTLSQRMDDNHQHFATLGTTMVHNDVDIHQQLVDELALVKSQLAVMVESIKEFGADKKGEVGQSRPVQGLNRTGEGSSGGQSRIRGRESSSRGGRGHSPRSDDPSDPSNNLDIRTSFELLDGLSLLRTRF